MDFQSSIHGYELLIYKSVNYEQLIIPPLRMKYVEMPFFSTSSMNRMSGGVSNFKARCPRYSETSAECKMMKSCAS
jgi:hypothetical protein